MTDLHINCPECGAEIEIAEQLAAPLVEAERERIAAQAVSKAQRDFQRKLDQAERDLAENAAKLEASEKAELEAHKAKKAAEEAMRKVELEVERQVDAEKERIVKEAGEKAAREFAARLDAAEHQNAVQAKKLQDAEKAELAARKAKAEADEVLRTAELAVERQLEEERGKIRRAATEEADKSHRLKLAEKEEQLAGMQRTIEELKRRSESGSQQLQGEVQELDLLEILERQFPSDRFERVAKGIKGSDIVQAVIGSSGQTCGTILWESKRTKAWSDGWLPKLREDQRESRADIAALVSQTLPDGISLFGDKEGVWVTSPACTLPMAAALRQGLIETARAQLALAGRGSRQEVVYNYLTGQEFRQRIAGLVEAYTGLRADLDKERRTYARLWNVREKQLDRMMHSMGGLYGDLQGLVGANMPDVPGLEFDDATTLETEKDLLAGLPLAATEKEGEPA